MKKKLTKNPCGDLSGISGNVSDIRGDVDDCEITPADRAAGIAVVDLTQ